MARRRRDDPFQRDPHPCTEEVIHLRSTPNPALGKNRDRNHVFYSSDEGAVPGRFEGIRPGLKSVQERDHPYAEATSERRFVPGLKVCTVPGSFGIGTANQAHVPEDGALDGHYSIEADLF